ncbi:MAG: dihydroxyacetone kinase subunit L [Azospirillaceae bacterium]
MATDGFDIDAIKDAARRIAAHMEACADELNHADGQLGDGDLGVTMVRGGRQVVADLDDLPEDLGPAFMKIAQGFTKTSGSSYGTLLATGLLATAKSVKGRQTVPWSEVSALIGGALDAMMQRGKAELGQKTVLDVIAAVRDATDGVDDPKALLDAADKAVDETLEAFRGQPAQVGRARIFAEKSKGLDDPGMLAFRRVIDGLKAG